MPCWKVSQPRSPCYRQGQRWNLPELPDELQSGTGCGWFYRVLRSGMVILGPAGWSSGITLN